jgi:hypothetical protein
MVRLASTVCDTPVDRLSLYRACPRDRCTNAPFNA